MKISVEQYRDKLRAAMLGRFCGCILGCPVEGWTIDRIKEYAIRQEIGFPMEDYWKEVPEPDLQRYIRFTFKDYTKPCFDGFPGDDDIAYTLLSLFIAEEGNGKDFTLQDVAAAWLKYITLAWTAEDIALKNLQKGISPEKAAEIDNPYQEWIGADIRCDGYGYMAPGDPAKAAEMAKTDALISHRGNGVYGSMYFAAVIALAFECDTVEEALVKGLDYIPADSAMADAVRWALNIAPQVKDPCHANELVTKRYPGMHSVHTLNNACLTIFALYLGGKDIGKVFANAVSMAYDCDCTAATAGSIAGACYGMDSLDKKWYECFGDKICSYFNGAPEYSLEDILKRYEKIALSE